MHISELINENGMRCRLSNLGARILSVDVPFARFNSEMLLNYACESAYIDDPYYMGAIIGRVSNRIGGGRFSLNGKDYRLSRNEGMHCLHGGRPGLSEREWKIEKSTASEVVYSYCSPHMENGFPGQADLMVKYRLSRENEICITLTGKVSQATPLSLTSHCYFNLGERTISDLSLQLSDFRYMVCDDENVATGEVADLRLDYPSVICGNRIALSAAHPLDHCMLLAESEAGQSNEAYVAAKLTSLKNNVVMRLYTDQPAIQLYTSSGLSHPFTPFSAICLEAQGVVNSINLPNTASPLATPSQPYCKTIVYQFSPFEK
ncbi:aldose epimerase family protein [Lacimicrobium sp. SS2-24]|uniref:aldose epimerase family protein n=1 Tax=Lacimicrobium sp. SS2-24 TaxID=2005569 RepID=UPI00143B91E1|nr:aldose epimerase family protein [Lacimicrobium sp. SS2-24]